jgi:hypothetical protein
VSVWIKATGTIQSASASWGERGFNWRELIERSSKIVDKFWSTRNQRNPKIHVLALAHSQMHEECNRADSE